MVLNYDFKNCWISSESYKNTVLDRECRGFQTFYGLFQIFSGRAQSHASEQFGDYFALLFCLHHPEIMTEKLVMTRKPQLVVFGLHSYFVYYFQMLAVIKGQMSSPEALHCVLEQDTLSSA